MSIIQGDLEGATVLDLFAGSGALGLEALSRGSTHATFVEQHARSLDALWRNIGALDATERVTVERADALKFIERLPAGAYDIAFADPPYGLGLAARVVSVWHERPFARLLAVEHAVRDPLAGGRTRRYGDTLLTFFRSDADA